MSDDSDGERTEKSPPTQAGRGRRAARVTGRMVHLALHLAFGAVTLSVLLAGLLWIRLAAGPIHLPLVAEAAERAFNAGSDRLRAEAGDVLLTLGKGGAPAGVQFADVRLSYVSGEPLFVIPRLSARFDLSDLARGLLRPIRLTLIRPEARVVRTEEGRFRFGLGAEAQDVGAAPDAQALPTEALQAAAIGRILDGLAGDIEPIPELSRLEEIAIRNANLVFENEEIGRRWHTRRADLRVRRTPDGLRAWMQIGLADEAGEGAGTTITAERLRGKGGATRLEARFEKLRPEHLAEQIEPMAWLRLFDAPLDGRLALTIYPDGHVEGLEGRISAGRGRILALADEGEPLEGATLAFSYESGSERMHIREFSLSAPKADARLAGFADIRRDETGEIAGFDGQFAVDRLNAEVPEVFAQPLAFDDGQIVARLDLDPLRISVADSYLRTGALAVSVKGEGRSSEDGWQTRLRAGGRNITVAQLVQFWPHVAAGGARAWVEENISAGAVDALVADMRFADGPPEVSLAFTYSGLQSSYLKDMSPIREAKGRGSLTLDRFDLVMDSGLVNAVEDAPVRLDGSVLRIPSLTAKPTVADITLRGAGRTASVLSLIDEEPLRLTSKLGLDPGTIGGTANVTTDLSVPLVSDLDLNGVGVAAEASLRALALPFRLPGGHVADVQGKTVALRADRTEMRLAGPVRVDGTAIDLEWNEYYGRGLNHRDISVAGDVTPAFLSRLDLGTEYFTGGRAPIRLRLKQSGSSALDFNLEAELGPARLAVADFDWEKPPRAPGRLEAEGTFGEDIRVPSFHLQTEELQANGAITFAKGGAMRSADVERLRFGGLADISLAATQSPGPAGALELDIGGRRLDLAVLESDEKGQESPDVDSSPGRPLSVDFNLDELVVTPKIVARPAAGAYQRDAGGKATANLEGNLAGRVPFTATYEKPYREPASIVVKSGDAGGLLAAAGFFGGAEGGKLRLKARLEPEEGVDFAGTARIRDVRIRSGGTFKSILAEGGADEAASAAEKGGLGFDDVELPFEVRGDKLRLRETIAKGNMLAVKVEGTVDEASNEVDLVGVISPAYGLTGALDSIPLLGTLLSGGEGEGIVAMTFKVRGTLESPEFSVNPLSLLTPGILRNIFSGKTAEPNQRFLEQLNRKVD